MRQIFEIEWDLNNGNISKASPFGSNFTMSSTLVCSWMIRTTNMSSGNSQSVYCLANLHLRESQTVTLKVQNQSKMTKLLNKRSTLAIWVNQKVSIVYQTISKLKVSQKAQMNLGYKKENNKNTSSLEYNESKQLNFRSQICPKKKVQIIKVHAKSLHWVSVWPRNQQGRLCLI